jgi:hypothetical protein
MSNVGREAIELIVKLSPEAAAAESPEHKELQAQADRLGVALTPLHPATSDPDLATYAVARVDPAEANVVAEQLRRCAGVEAAYAKARGAPPERRTHHARQSR